MRVSPFAVMIGAPTIALTCPGCGLLLKNADVFGTDGRGDAALDAGVVSVF